LDCLVLLVFAGGLVYLRRWPRNGIRTRAAMGGRVTSQIAPLKASIKPVAVKIAMLTSMPLLISQL